MSLFKKKGGVVDGVCQCGHQQCFHKGGYGQCLASKPGTGLFSLFFPVDVMCACQHYIPQYTLTELKTEEPNQKRQI